MNKIDISDYDSFIDAGFKECSKCGWAFDPEFFDTHSCIDMKMPAHNHILAGDPDCPKDCPYKLWNDEHNNTLPTETKQKGQTLSKGHTE